jgi:SAM-dependent methyltransferase
MFRRQLPVYPVVERIDNVNFSPSTTWEGEIKEGDTFKFHQRRAPGHQYILEATNLAPIPDDGYELALSSHTLEHSANPLQALAEWRRVLRPDGSLVLVLPHKERTFDHKRPGTTLGHLIEDYERRTPEDDLTHHDEIIALHDLALDPPAGSAEQFAARSKENAINRCFHQHVFDTNLALAVVDHAGFQVLAVEPMLPFHIILVARGAESPRNEQLMRPDADWRAQSPFDLDRGAVGAS